MTDSVYDELVIDLIKNCNINAFNAWKIVTFLREKDILDYDNLKEYYEDEV